LKRYSVNWPYLAPDGFSQFPELGVESPHVSPGELLGPVAISRYAEILALI
jgi:hypothetical protein